MTINEKIKVAQAREYKVVKSNDIIQKARFDLSIVEQKTIAYIVSMIKPKERDSDALILEYDFNIQDYCKICGIDYNNGGNYEYIKSTLKKLRDKSMWVTLSDGTETVVSWINKPYINKRSGKAKIRLDDDMIPYLFELKERFTQYELYNTLAMKSQYSIRLYEIFKSYSFAKKKIFDLDELKKMLFAQNYINFKDFRKYVLEIALKEINEFTDITVSYEPVKQGRKVVQVIFEIKNKNVIESTIAKSKAYEVLDSEENWDIEGQLNFEDYVEELPKSRKGAKK